MTKSIKLPPAPRVSNDGRISNKSKENLLKWEAVFEDLGCIVYLEEDAGGLIKLTEGTLMQVVFSIFPEDIKVLDFGFGEAILSVENKGCIQFAQALTSFNDTFDKIEKEYASPITREYKEATWKEIYDLIVSYIAFRDKIAPLAPK